MSDGDVWALGLALLVGAGLPLVPLALGWRVLMRRRAVLARMRPIDGRLEQLGIGPPMPSDSYRMPFLYRIITRYHYTVEGAHLVGHRFSLDLSPWFGGFAEAHETIAGLAAGEPVTVWYDPDDPATAVLSKALPRGLSGFRAATLVAAALAGLGALLMLA